jgi:hypothetical protein
VWLGAAAAALLPLCLCGLAGAHKALRGSKVGSFAAIGAKAVEPLAWPMTALCGSTLPQHPCPALLCFPALQARRPAPLTCIWRRVSASKASKSNPTSS